MLKRIILLLNITFVLGLSDLSCLTDTSSLPESLPSYLFNNCSTVENGKVECKESDISFFLYNSSGKFEITPEIISKMDKSAKTIVTVHGAAPINDSSSIFTLKDAYISSSHYNFILVNWEKCSGNFVESYASKVANTKFVGNIVANFINDITNSGVPLESIQIIGFSMGGHVIGFAGKSLQRNYKKTLDHLTSIDPSGAGFCDCDPKNRLDKTDAKCVEVLHMSKLRGCPCPIGTVDYFVNGGIVQPGCNETPDDNPECSHNFGNHLLAEVVRSKSDNCKKRFCFSKEICDGEVNPLQNIGSKFACIQPGVISVETNAFGSRNICG